MEDARSRLERVTVMVGVVAAMTLAVTLSSALSLQVGSSGGRPVGSAADAPSAGGDGAAGAAVRRVVRDVPGAGGLRVRLALPDAAWSAAAPDTVAGYRSPAGEALLVSGPVFFRRGWCADDPQWSSRAFAGVVPRVAGVSARAAGDDLTRRWSDVVRAFVGEERGVGSGRARGSAPARGSPVRLGGREAWLTTRTVGLTATGSCLPPRVSVDALTVDVDGAVIAVVVVRDVGVPGALTRPASAGFLLRTRVLAQSLRNRT